MECPICWDPVSSPIILQCNHMYCRDCLVETIKHGNKTCPYCRASIEISPIKPTLFWTLVAYLSNVAIACGITLLWGSIISAMLFYGTWKILPFVGGVLKCYVLIIRNIYRRHTHLEETLIKLLL